MAGTQSSWTIGLFDCCSDCRLCCLTCWCPCVTFGRISEIIDKGRSSCFTNGVLYVLLRLMRLGWVFSLIYRTKMREQYNLRGSALGDFFLSCLCEECTLCQEYHELRNQGFDLSVGWEEHVRRRNPGVEMAPTVEGGMKR